ncbi:hypothetical protein PANT_14d00006 [Moesziomyces antarcticus T-34]|uniref:F-box domain-containing protein n=1 Tax=Pseudozyma antarctica (strain T-34) TaxID=1151754 RepID=M9ME64_PSEA3|nr:hypothetical protein PANT_14d00006 [Moesziomyces antarcticus T-34]
MTPALPLEIVDLILLLSLEQGGGSIRRGREALLPQGASTSSSTTSPASSLSPAALRRLEQVLDPWQAAAISCLSRHHRQRFEQQLYRHVYLHDVRTIALLCRTLSARPDLCHHVRSLALFCDPSDGSHRLPSGVPTADFVDGVPEPSADITSAADVILSACPNITHLLLSCDHFSSLSAGIYRLLQPKEITLVSVASVAVLDGIVKRHRDLTAAALQDDPRMRAILGTASSAAPDEPSPIGVTFPAHESSPAPSTAPPTPHAERSLSHLHLVNFDGRLLHHLATLSSLTHLVLTHPILPETRPGMPGLSIIPRSHLMLLLGSGNVQRIVIRADLATCIRLVEELAPIEDQKLVFRPLAKSGDLLFPEPERRPRFSASLTAQASRLYDAVAASKLDLLSEFFGRVRVHAHRFESSLSSDDPDTSRGSSTGFRHPRSSDSSGGATSQSASTGWDDDGSDDVDDEALQEFGAEDSPEPPASEDPGRSVAATAHASTSINAPPLNIPIEELLRAERFTPAGLARTAAPASQASSGSHDLSSSASSSPHGQRRRLHRSPFALRKTDLRGATNSNLDILANLYEALASHAGLGQEMNFW